MILVYILRAVYTVLSCFALAFELFPWTRETFVRYGKTRKTSEGSERRSNGLLSWFASLTLPKYLFSQFYCFGVIFSALLTIDIIDWSKNSTSYEANMEQHSSPWGLLSVRFMALDRWLTGINGLVSDGDYSMFVGIPNQLVIMALGMYNIHIIIRLKETVYDQPATKAKMHVGQYLVGLTFYLVTPFAIVADSYYQPGWTNQSPLLVLSGLALFIYASIHQWRCHKILYSLRYRMIGEENERERSDHQALPAYAVPTGDLFNYVACPHYLCEILIYISIWLVTACQSRTILWTIGWTVINLAITARESQGWYLRTFKDKYPRNRRALIPFVW